MSAEPTAAGTRRVLIVDDEDIVRSVLQRLLARMPTPPSVQVHGAPSAEAALECLERERYDLILSDFNMGGKDGIFLLSQARERYPDTVRCLMTGYTDDEIRRDAVDKGGAAVVIQKPWDNKAVLLLLRDLLQDVGSTDRDASAPGSV